MNFFLYMGARSRARACYYKHGPCQPTGFWEVGLAWSGTTVAGTGRAIFLAF